MKAINSGGLEFIGREKLPQNVLAYKRKAGNEEILVVMNFGKADKYVNVPESYSSILFSISPGEKITGGKIHLGSFGAVILSK